MPHCVIEYSKGIEKIVHPSKLMDAVFKGALQSNLFEADDIKTRAISFEHAQLGSKAKAFVHVTARILSGRNLKEKKGLSNQILKHLRTMNLNSISLTVEVTEIERESYSKIVV